MPFGNSFPYPDSPVRIVVCDLACNPVFKIITGPSLLIFLITIIPFEDVIDSLFVDGNINQNRSERVKLSRFNLHNFFESHRDWE